MMIGLIGDVPILQVKQEIEKKSETCKIEWTIENHTE